MPVRRRPPPRTLFSDPRRSGKATLALLLALPALLLSMSLAFYGAELVEARMLLRNDTDAAALAGVQTFVDDYLLRSDPNRMKELIPLARQNCQQYAGLNLVQGQGVYLDPNSNNEEDGDIVVGTLPYPRSKEFILPNLSTNFDPNWLNINTVRVTGRRSSQHPNGPVNLHSGLLLSRAPSDVEAVSTATLDRYVIGFRPMGRQPLPLCPLALFSFLPGSLKHCWEYNIEKRRGDDAYKVRRNGPYYQILKGDDGLHEMDVFLGAGQEMEQSMKASRSDLNLQLRQGKFNCCMLYFGSSQVRDLVPQIVNGVDAEHLSAFGGQLVLGPGNQLIVNGTPWGPQNSSWDGNLMQSALQQLQASGVPRLWPCFACFDKETSKPVLCGFVAARVVQVKQRSGKGASITFTVQPCMMSTGTAITDAGRVGIGTAKLPNPYICKVRLVE
ncbi:MAG TPA: hypothetical protein VH592_03880 [Gemmataceae bacterium]